MNNYNGPPESAMGLWYDPSINRFMDDNGFILHDLHEFFDLWQLDEWKKTRDYGLLEDRNGNLWELFYPIDYDTDGPFDVACNHACTLCVSKCEIFDFLKDYQQEQNYIQIRKDIFK